MLATLTSSITKNARRVVIRHISTTSAVNREPGKIKWFNVTKGYGFIAPESGDRDLFLHASNFAHQDTRDIRFYDDMPCEFDAEESDRGPVAVNVTVPDEDDF